MPCRSRTLSKYPPFSWLGHRFARWASIANWVIAVVTAVLFVIGAWRDGTFTLAGESIGLLQHPGIWIYLLAQPLLPALIDKAVLAFAKISLAQGNLFNPPFISMYFRRELHALSARIRRQTPMFELLYRLLVSAGIGAWALNTLKNQHALLSYGFDVWDAWPHVWGYWVTRAYKLYIAVFLAPAIVHAQVAIVTSITQLVINARRTKSLHLDPYNPDEAGGTRSLIDTVLNPMVPIVLTASLMCVAAVWVHKQFDLTTVGGLSITIAIFIVVYVVPAVALRYAIETDKNRQRAVLRERQAVLYRSLQGTDALTASDRQSVGLIQDLSVVIARIDQLPVWPQLTRVAAAISAAAASPVLAILFSRVEQLAKLLRLVV